MVVIPLPFEELLTPHERYLFHLMGLINGTTYWEREILKIMDNTDLHTFRLFLHDLAVQYETNPEEVVNAVGKELALQLPIYAELNQVPRRTTNFAQVDLRELKVGVLFKLEPEAAETFRVCQTDTLGVRYVRHGIRGATVFRYHLDGPKMVYLAT